MSLSLQVSSGVTIKSIIGDDLEVTIDCRISSADGAINVELNGYIVFDITIVLATVLRMHQQ